MNVAFAVYDFSPGNLRLQPWLTIDRVASELCGSDNVFVFTWAGGTDFGHDRPYRTIVIEGSQRSLRGAVDQYSIDVLVTLPTPQTLVSGTDFGVPIVGYASYGFYSLNQVLSRLPQLGFRTTWPYLKQAAVPHAAWSIALRKRYAAVIAQSFNTAVSIDRACGMKIARYVPAGIDPPLTVPARGERAPRRVITYVGSPRRIRGIDTLLEALPLIRTSGLTLKILARGADAALVDQLRRSAGSGSVRVEVKGDWLEREQLEREIADSDFVLQPFLLVPSEFPVAALEAIQLGTPIIYSALPSLVSEIGAAGLAVRPGSARDLAQKIDSAYSCPGPKSYRAAAQAARGFGGGGRLRRWPEVASAWRQVLTEALK